MYITFPARRKQTSVFTKSTRFVIVLNNRYILDYFTLKSRSKNVTIVIFPFFYKFRQVSFVKETAPSNRFVYSSIND